MDIIASWELKMQKQINEIIKYGIRPWVNPEMTAYSQNGYVITAGKTWSTSNGNTQFYTCFGAYDSTIESGTLFNNNVAGSGTTTLSFPSPKIIEKIYFPLYGGNYGWGYPNTSSWTAIGYLKGVAVFTKTGGVGSIVSVDKINCDKITTYANNCCSPDWLGWSAFKFTGYEV